MEAQEHSNLERLLNKQFSGDTEKMFNALQGQLQKQAVKKENCVPIHGTTQAIYLRAFIKGLNLLKASKKANSDILDSDNLFNFSGNNGTSRGVSFTPVASLHNGVPGSPRLPLPSLSSVVRHLSDYTEVKVIRSKHLRILNLDMQGIYSRKEIAQMIGCSEPTITNVLSSEAVQQFKRRAQNDLESEYGTLFKPSIEAIRDSLQPGRDISLRQDTAFKYLRSQGRGVESSIQQHEHHHVVTGKNGGPIQVSEVKQKMLQKLGYSPENIIDGNFREITKDAN